MNLPTSPRPRARGVTLGVAVLAASGLIAACGSSSSTSSNAAAGTTSTSNVASTSGSGASGSSARRASLVACLKQHGVTLPSRPPGSGSGGSGTSTGPPAGGGFFGGGGGGGGRFRQLASNPKMQAAFKACGANFRPGSGRRFGRISHQAVTNYVTCVRQHGFNMPAPNFSGKGSVFPASIRSNPKFQAASRQCQHLLIPPRSGSSSSGGATSGA